MGTLIDCVVLDNGKVYCWDNELQQGVEASLIPKKETYGKLPDGALKALFEKRLQSLNAKQNEE